MKKFKVGDKVRFKGPDRDYLYINTSTIYTVEEIINPTITLGQYLRFREIRERHSYDGHRFELARDILFEDKL